MEKFQNKYRIQSARWESWDYSNNGMYFITSCCKHRRHLFGEVINAEMMLNEIGIIANESWTAIPNHFDHVELREYVIMPNHMHGIITIKTPPANPSIFYSKVKRITSVIKPNKHPRFQNQGKHTISAMVGSFKSATTKSAHLISPDFGWQSRFHDRVIRTEYEYQKIRNYILSNPANWKEDKYYGL